MQNNDNSGAQKAKWPAKTLAITLLCLLWVCLAAVLPGVLVGMNDRQLYDRFTPTGGAKVTPGFTDAALQWLETLREYKASTLFAGEEMGGGPVTDGARISAACELLLSLLAETQDAGLLTASEIEIFPLLLAPASESLELTVFGNEDEDRFIGIRAANGSGMQCEMRYDTQEDKALALSLVLPTEALGILPQPVNVQKALRAYIGFLGISELDDFAISAQADGAAVAYSPAADLLLARRAATQNGIYRVEYNIS